MSTGNHTFDKSERLCSFRIISDLFETGNVFHNQLFKVVWMKSPVKLPFPAQVTFSVTKRGFRHAVTRNLIKRRMREAYRKNKDLLYEKLSPGGIQLVFVIIMKGTTIPDYAAIERSVKDILLKLADFAQK